VEAACKRAITSDKMLEEVALANGQVRAILSPREIAQALDPARYLGSTDRFIDRAIEEYRQAG
jgi:3-carboxy-cis,cis-muconate cycloisomerase